MKGGKRIGAGRPKGRKDGKTLEREAVKKLFDERVLRAYEPILNSQIGNAVGSQYLYKIEKEKIVGPKGGISYKSKKPELVTEQWEIQAYLEGLIKDGDMQDIRSPGATYYYLTAKDPDNTAADSLFNRVWGRAKESVELSGNVQFSLKKLSDEAEKTEKIEKAKS